MSETSRSARATAQPNEAADTHASGLRLKHAGISGSCEQRQHIAVADAKRAAEEIVQFGTR